MTEDQNLQHTLTVTKYNSGFAAGVNYILAKILRDSDKLQVIKALRAKSNNIANQYGREKGILTPYSKDCLLAYSNGIRHCLHILESCGDPLEAHNAPEHVNFNDQVKIYLTEEDIAYYR